MNQMQIAGPGTRLKAIAGLALFAATNKFPTADTGQPNVNLASNPDFTDTIKNPGGVDKKQTAAIVTFAGIGGPGIEARQKGRGARKGWSGKRPAGVTDINVHLRLDGTDDDAAPRERDSKHHPRLDTLIAPGRLLVAEATCYSGLHAS